MTKLESDSWSDRPLIEPLTAREMEIVSLLAENRTNPEIADALVLSLNTVKWYARQIYGKLGVRSRRQAVARARQLGLLKTGALAAKPAHNLPSQLTPFLGRRQLVAEIIRLMAEPATRLLTLVGPGGIGKTRLAIASALQLLEAHADLFRDGIYLVSLAGLNNQESITAAMAQAVGFQFYHGRERPEQQLVGYLSNKRKLLVLDNFEHLVGHQSAHLLMEILAAASGAKLMVTSRSKLNLHGEHLIPLGGMEIPQQEAIAQWQHPVEQAMAFSGIQLFVQSARRQRSGFELDAQNLPAVVHACSLVDGLPLGIELAAGWIAVLEPKEIAAEIEQSLDILTTDALNVPQRQQSLRHVFDASWQLLSEPEQQACQTLAAFEDGFDREAAQHAGQVSLSTLAALINKSWIQQVADGRFGFHDLLRRYAREKLARDLALEATVLDRHSQYYSDWLAKQEEGTWGGQQVVVLAAIDGNLGNILAACRWSAKRGKVHRLVRVVNALGLFYYQWRGRYKAGQTSFQELVEVLGASSRGPDSETATVQRAMVRLKCWLATFCSEVGDPSASTRLLREALALLDGPALSREDTRFERAHIDWESGYLLLYSDPETAREHFSRSLSLYGQLGCDFGQAHALLGLGRAARGAYAFEEASQALTSSLALHRKLGNRHGETETLTTLGGLAGRLGRSQEAESLIQQSLSITPDTDRYGTAFGLGLLGTVRIDSGRFLDAEVALRQCLAIHRDLGMRSFGLHWRYTLGEAYLNAGNYAAARREAQGVVALARELGYDRGMNLGLLLLSELALVEADFALAYRHLQESPDPANLDTLASREFGQLAVLGLATTGLGRLEEAREYLLSAMRWARQAQRFLDLLISLTGFALLSVKEGQAERAAELYALAARYPFVASSRWLSDVIGRHIAVAAASLPQDVVQAARERGRDRDLEAVVAELTAEQGS